MYIKLSFILTPWIVPQCAGGVSAQLSAEPMLFAHLPAGVKPNRYSSQLVEPIGKQVQTDYYLDCKNLNTEEVTVILAQYAANYKHNSKRFPHTQLTGILPCENRLINQMEGLVLKASKDKKSENSCFFLHNLFKAQKPGSESDEIKRCTQM